MMDRTGGVVAFTIPGPGHIHRMLPIVAGLCEAGIPVHFFANREAKGKIERTGARFVDLYTGRDINETDPASQPRQLRCVSFAGVHGDAVVAEAAALRPRLVLHDTFAVIGRVVAYHLGIPRVNALSGDAGGRRSVPSDLSVSPICAAAVQTLRDRHGIPDASPFSFQIDSGADLTLHAYPPEFRPPAAVPSSAPHDFFGSYWPAGTEARNPSYRPFGCDAGDRLRVYVSFGTAVWHHHARAATAALEVVADALAERPDIRALISLGGYPLPGAVERLTRPNLAVSSYVNQIQVLEEASVYLTHHGLNSTHEALYHGVPMISHPFGGDQWDTAARCQELGLAVPLVTGPARPITVADVRTALAWIGAGGDGLRARLAAARAWELAVIDRRPAVIRRIADLMG